MINFLKRVKQRLAGSQPQHSSIQAPTAEAVPANSPQLEVDAGTINALQRNLLYIKFAPPGHYYSPLPELAELRASQDRIFNRTKKQLLRGINIDDEMMLGYLEKFKKFYPDFPFEDQKKEPLRFWMDNGVYSRGDAILLYSMMRYLKPKRIVEAGSGMSSCLMLDVNELFLNNSVNLTFIDPYPERMLSMVHPEDVPRINVLHKKLQEIDLKIYEDLEPNDIAFFDSTHVSKCDSDVNFIFFEILPILKPGVFIHFHDTFYPFEYPKEWLLDIGAAWNETYVLRSFLEFNTAFEIVFFCDYLAIFHRDQIRATLPRFLDGPGGSIWLRRIA
ncbi:MAG: class I SAM-dependent methyltransferase [Syntrophothermus sp.]